MSRIFISHSHADNLEAIAFRDWLIDEGWGESDVFIDLHNLNPGERWKEALTKANERCEAVVFLASPASLASTECRLELRMAEDYGKEIIVALLPLIRIDNPDLGPYKDRQIVELGLDPRDAVFTVAHDGQTRAVHFSRATLAKIKHQLNQLGIAPNTFAWLPRDLDTASPYPGLQSFDTDDAALFFGRSGDIARGISELRKLRRMGQGRILLIQAASGAGKSSFLKAGLWPRLARDREFLPLAMLRPATGIITGGNGLGQALSKFFVSHGQSHTPVSLHRLFRGDADAAAKALLDFIDEAVRLGTEARLDALAPTPLIAVDQAEELFGAVDAEEKSTFS